MAKLKLASWNVNGIRAASKKGLFEWMEKSKSDIVCLQESKIAAVDLVNELTERHGYTSYWSHAEKKGYSGVVIYTKEKPLSIKHGFGIERFDSEGRTLIAEYADFVLYNIYFPNGKKDSDRLQYKMDFYDAFLKHATALRKKGKSLIICGDYNTAHKEIDLARPKENEDESGFLPMERAWMDKLVKSGYIDTFRLFNNDPHNYTWWHMRTAARERNVGWRIDYFFASDDMEKKLAAASIESKVMGSDHCPVTLELKL